jgi:hypothetical protein
VTQSKRRKPPTLEEELEALGDVLRDPGSPSSQERMREALAHGRALAVARVASTIGARRLLGFEGDLERAFSRFLENPVKTDPGCRAKAAALEALDRLEHREAAPFVAGARYHQREPSWGSPNDTAGTVRARAIAALARIGHADFLLVAGALLGDPLPIVRRAAADALAHHGARDCAALVLLKLRLGDEDEQVLFGCIAALMALAPDRALGEIEPLLFGEDAARRELAAVALGDSGREDALDVLLASLDRTVSVVERVPLLRGVALHRSERAGAFLLERVATGSEAEARAALEALAARNFDPNLTEHVREAARANDRADLESTVDEMFPARPA